MKLDWEESHDEEAPKDMNLSRSPSEFDSDSARAQSTEHPASAAVMYIRVSTREQAEKGGDPEGFSIPAQRQACLRKAEALGAEVVGEFVDAGESAKTADRPELQRLLQVLAERHIDYVIVHKVDRLARNRADDVMINIQLQQAGATLVSCSENIDETPSGKLLHGIMASIAEFYSRNLGTEALKGMTQKAQRGGTVGKAPIGYQNVGKVIDGREVRLVDLDPKRASLVAWGFEAYATGDWTISALLDELTARGLTTVETRTRVEKPLAPSRFHALLRNRYYLGKIIFKGIEYDGIHPPLVTPETFAAVQDILDSHRSGEKEREHPHYLKGTVFCASCGSRLCITRTVNRHGSVYMYYFCLGRHRKRNDCQQKSMVTSEVEALVEREWATIHIDATYGALLQSTVGTELTKLQGHNTKTERSVKRQLEMKREKRKKLLDAYLSGAIPTELLRSEQHALTKEIESLEFKLVRAQMKIANLELSLRKTLEFLQDPQRIYLEAPVRLRRQLNQAVWDEIHIGADDPQVEGVVAEPFATLLDPDLLQPTNVCSDTGPVAWSDGRPDWIEIEKNVATRHRRQGCSKGLKDSCLGAVTGRHSNHRRPLAVGLKDGGLAAPTGFEPVSPP